MKGCTYIRQRPRVCTCKMLTLRSIREGHRHGGAREFSQALPSACQAFAIVEKLKQEKRFNCKEAKGRGSAAAIVFHSTVGKARKGVGKGLGVSHRRGGF